MRILDFWFQILNWKQLGMTNSKVLMTVIRHWSLVIRIVVLLSAPCSMLHAQSTRSLINDGNANFRKEKYTDAEISYRKALEKEKKNPYAHYNLGNSLYRQQKTDEALEQYQDAATKATDDNVKSKAFYNMGNTYVQTQKYSEAIASYKNSLKLNPNDDDAKYNLSYALKMIREQEKKNDQNQQDKNQDDKQQQQNQQQQQGQQNKQEQKQNQQQQQQQAQQDQTKQQRAKEAQAKRDEKKMKKDQAEAILNQLKNNEKKLQKELRKQPAQNQNVEKDW